MSAAASSPPRQLAAGRRPDATRFILSRGTGVVLALALLLQHLQIALVAGYPLTVGALAALALLPMLLPRLDVRAHAVAFPAIIFLGGLAAVLDPLHADLAQFGQTLALIFLSTFFMLFAFSGLRRRTTGPYTYPGVLFFVLCLVTGICVLQAVTGFFGLRTFFNLFGTHQYLYQYELWIVPGEAPRAQGFYLEPSYAALTITFLCGSILRFGYRQVPTILLALAGIMSTQSATGIATFAIIALCWGISQRGRAMAVALFSTIVLLLGAGSYLAARLSSATEASSSANYRLLAPLPLLRAVLMEFPLGRPIGSIRQVTAEASLVNGVSAGTTIDNGYMVIVFYFGWIGLIAVVVGMALLMRRLVVSIRAGDGVAPLLVWLLACPFFNGGIFLPEFAMMIWLGLAALVPPLLTPERRLTRG